MYLSPFRKALAIVIVSSINFTCAHLLFFIWKESYYFYVILFIGTLLVGALDKNYVTSVLYTLLSFLIATVTSLGILIGPTIIFGGEYVVTDIAILSYGSSLVKMSLINVPLCILIVLLGCYVGQVAETRSHSVQLDPTKRSKVSLH